MTISTVWPAASRGEELWIASNAQLHARRYFGSLGGAKNFFTTRFPTTRTDWHEMAYDTKTWESIDPGTSSRREQREKLTGCRAVSGLMMLTSSTRLAGQYPVEKWKDTGWRLWRAQ